MKFVLKGIFNDAKQKETIAIHIAGKKDICRGKMGQIRSNDFFLIDCRKVRCRNCIEIATKTKDARHHNNRSITAARPEL